MLLLICRKRLKKKKKPVLDFNILVIKLTPSQKEILNRLNVKEALKILNQFGANLYFRNVFSAFVTENYCFRELYEGNISFRPFCFVFFKKK